jgi:hypothetical protein
LAALRLGERYLNAHLPPDGVSQNLCRS